MPDKYGRITKREKVETEAAEAERKQVQHEMRELMPELTRPLTALEQFGQLVRMSRLRNNLTCREVATACLIGISQYCDMESGTRVIGERSIRMLCSLFEIRSAEVWILAITRELPKTLNLKQAYKIAEALELAPVSLPSRDGILRRLPRREKFTCLRCNHEWHSRTRPKNEQRPGRCPKCAAILWYLTDEQYQQRISDSARRNWVEHGMRKAIQTRINRGQIRGCKLLAQS
jgi:hypothetical protein